MSANSNQQDGQPETPETQGVRMAVAHRNDSGDTYLIVGIKHMAATVYTLCTVGCRAPQRVWPGDPIVENDYYIFEIATLETLAGQEILMPIAQTVVIQDGAYKYTTAGGVYEATPGSWDRIWSALDAGIRNAAASPGLSPAVQAALRAYHTETQKRKLYEEEALRLYAEPGLRGADGAVRTNEEPRVVSATASDPSSDWVLTDIRNELKRERTANKGDASYRDVAQYYHDLWHSSDGAKEQAFQPIWN